MDNIYSTEKWKKIAHCLKPCPFCNGKANLVIRKIPDGNISYKVGYVECAICHARTRDFQMGEYYGMKQYTYVEICSEWNRRDYK